MIGRRILPWVALVAALALAVAARAEIEVPRALAEALGQARAALDDGTPAKALARVDGWTGDPHPLLHVTRGHALIALDRAAEAVSAYDAALALEPTARSAGLGLVGALARLERWDRLADTLPRWAPLTPDAERGTHGLWLSMALGRADLPLAEAVARQAMLRFPSERRFRQALADVLLRTGRPDAARPLLEHALDAHPDEPALWSLLAFAHAEAGRADEARASLEAALLLSPEDGDLRARLARARLEAAQPQAALELVEPLAGTPAHRPLAIRVAVEAGDLERAAHWLGAATAAEQTPALRRLAAQVALGRGDHAAARAHLGALLQVAPDATVLVRLAGLERRAGALDRAEALLRRAAGLDGAAARLAILHLADLLLARSQPDAAAAILRRHLVDHPDDSAAQQLLAVARTRAAAPADLPRQTHRRGSAD